MKLPLKYMGNYYYHKKLIDEDGKSYYEVGYWNPTYNDPNYYTSTEAPTLKEARRLMYEFLKDYARQAGEDMKEYIETRFF